MTPAIMNPVNKQQNCASPALGSYAAWPSLDFTVHVSVARLVPLLGICTHLKKGT